MLRRSRWFSAVLGVLVAAALTAAVPAGAAEGHPPVIEHCWWWPGDTVVHWDNAWLKANYGNFSDSTVVRVEFQWSHVLAGGTWQVVPTGDTVKATTPIQALDVRAVLGLANGNTVYTNRVDCVLH